MFHKVNAQLKLSLLFSMVCSKNPLVCLIFSAGEALSQAFVRTDLAFRQELDSHRQSKRVSQKDWHPGCTAIVSLLVENKLFVANVGDSRAILCRAGHPFALSKVRRDYLTESVLR